MGKIFRTTKTIVHQGYHPDKHYLHNIALLEVDRNITFNSATKRVNLYPFPIKDGTQMNTIGWGKTKCQKNQMDSPICYQIPIDVPDQLKFRRVRYINNEQCAFYYHNVIDIPPSCLCIDRNNGSSIYGRDLGGALTRHGKLIGIALAAHHVNCNYIFPNIYIRTSSYAAWINRTISSYM